MKSATEGHTPDPCHAICRLIGMGRLRSSMRTPTFDWLAISCSSAARSPYTEAPHKSEVYFRVFGRSRPKRVQQPQLCRRNRSCSSSFPSPVEGILKPRPSLMARAISCSGPRQRSVAWVEECTRRTLTDGEECPQAGFLDEHL